MHSTSPTTSSLSARRPCLAACPIYQRNYYIERADVVTVSADTYTASHSSCTSVLCSYTIHPYKGSSIYDLFSQNSNPSDNRLTMSYRTHLTVLEQSAALYSSSPAFKLPRLSPADKTVVEEWVPVSYEQFLLDVERSARHWARTLSLHGLPMRSIVGLW